VVTANTNLTIDNEGTTVLSLAQQELLTAWSSLGRLT
jgi:hypothetical protein